MPFRASSVSARWIAVEGSAAVMEMKVKAVNNTVRRLVLKLALSLGLRLRVRDVEDEVEVGIGKKWGLMI